MTNKTRRSGIATKRVYDELNDEQSESATHRIEKKWFRRYKMKQTFWIKRAHVLGLLGVERPDLDLVLQNGRWVALVEHLIYRHIECWYHFLRIADKLPVQRLVERFQMVAVDVQKRLLQRVNLQRKIAALTEDVKRMFFEITSSSFCK